MKDIFDTVLLKAAGITADHPLADVVTARTNIIELSENSHDASLKPKNPGGISHAERAALASRIARLNNEDVLARHYDSLIEGGADSGVGAIADTAFDGADDSRLKAILKHTDLVTVNPKDATRENITALKSAGISEQDIVRLSEIIAFVSYQIRVVAGLRLMGEAV